MCIFVHMCFIINVRVQTVWVYSIRMRTHGSLPIGLVSNWARF